MSGRVGTGTARQSRVGTPGDRYRDRNRTNRTDQNRTAGPDRTRTGVTSAEQRLLIMDHGSRIMDHGSWIMDQGSWIKDHRSRILDLGPWTLDWHERPSWKGYGRDIKTIQIYYQRSIILYRFYKDRIKDLGSWTLFWHERPF